MISSPRRLKTAFIMNNPKSLTCSDVFVGASKVPGTHCQFARKMGFGRQLQTLPPAQDGLKCNSLSKRIPRLADSSAPCMGGP